MSNDAAINVKNLVKQYGDLTAVNDISFDVKCGEIFAFLGPNGAGKTTTVEILVGLRKPTSGGANVLGFDIAKDREEIKKSIGVLPQSFNTYDRLTVKENIEYFAGMFDSSPDVDGLIKRALNLRQRGAQGSDDFRAGRSSTLQHAARQRNGHHLHNSRLIDNQMGRRLTLIKK